MWARFRFIDKVPFLLPLTSYLQVVVRSSKRANQIHLVLALELSIRQWIPGFLKGIFYVSTATPLRKRHGFSLSCRIKLAAACLLVMLAIEDEAAA